MFLGAEEELSFHTHLRLIADYGGLHSTTLKDRLHEFSQAEYKERIDLQDAINLIGREKLDKYSDPAVWKIAAVDSWDSAALLDMYPLKKLKTDPVTKESRGTVYYMVSGMPAVSWMKTALAAGGPNALQYRKQSDNQIIVEMPGRTFPCNTKPGDEILLLKDLFLKDSHWCKVPKSSDTHTQRIKASHKVTKLRDRVMSDDEVAVCLAPLTLRFLGAFRN